MTTEQINIARDMYEGGLSIESIANMMDTESFVVARRLIKTYEDGSIGYEDLNEWLVCNEEG